MNYLGYKFKFIYSRYLIIALGSIIGFSLLNICLFQTAFILFEDFYYELIIPLFLPIIPLVFWLRPRLKLLKLERKNGKNLFDFYLVIAWLVISPSSILAQKYITDAVGSLSRLKSIDNIDQGNPTKFYKIQNLYLDKAHPAVRFDSRVNGKNNKNLVFTVYAAVPIYAAPLLPPTWAAARPDEAGKPSKKIASNYLSPKAWLGWEKALIISNKTKKEVKDSIFRNFIKDSYVDFKNDKIYGFDYLQKISINRDYKNFKLGISYAHTNAPAEPILLLPKYGPFEKRGRDHLIWSVLLFCTGSAIWFLMLIPVNFRDIKILDALR